MLNLFLLLVFAHFIFDFPLQGDFIAVNKNPWNKDSKAPWYVVMFAHAFMHGAIVGMILSPLYGLIEMLVHFYRDVVTCGAKNQKPESANFIFVHDQLFHILCKLFYVLLYYVSSLYFLPVAHQ